MPHDKEIEVIRELHSQMLNDLSLILAKYPGIENKENREYIITMYAGHGLTHSNRGTGMFCDIYMREGILSQNSLLPHLLTMLYDHDQKRLIIPMQNRQACHDAIEAINNAPNPNNYIYKASFESDENGVYVAIIFDPNYSPDELFAIQKVIVGFLGREGRLPTKDALIGLFAKLMRDRETYEILDVFSSLLAKSMESYYDNCPQIIDPFSYFSLCYEVTFYEDMHSHGRNISILGTTLDEYEEMIDESNKESSDQVNDSYVIFSRFFIKILRPIIKELNYDKLQQKFGEDKHKLDIVMLAVSSLLYKSDMALKACNHKDFKMFVNYIEFAIDEVVRILSVIQLYNEEDFYKTIQAFLSERLCVEGDMPSKHVKFYGSGMHAMREMFDNSVEQLQSASSVPLKVFYNDGMYFEVAHVIGTREKLNKIRIVKSHEEKVDILVLGNSVSATLPGHDKVNLQKLLKKQLLGGRDKPLILILDVTQEPVDSIEISDILSDFKDYIQRGELVISVVHSANKYLSMVDKFFSAFSHTYYVPKKFPLLAASNSFDYYSASDPSMQLLCHFFANAGLDIVKYYDNLNDIARSIHEQVPSDLKDSTKFITIENPVVDNPTEDIWNFLNIRVNIESFKQYPGLLELFIARVYRLFKVMGITPRDGYGPALTSVSHIGKGQETLSFRICLGLDAPNKDFGKLFEFLSRLNEEIDKAPIKGIGDLDGLFPEVTSNPFKSSLHNKSKMNRV